MHYLYKYAENYSEYLLFFLSNIVKPIEYLKVQKISISKNLIHDNAVLAKMIILWL